MNVVQIEKKSGEKSLPHLRRKKVSFQRRTVDENNVKKMGVYLDGAVDGAREETTSRDGETSDAALVSHQGLGTRHVLHVPHLHTGTNEEERNYQRYKGSPQLARLYIPPNSCGVLNHRSLYA